MMSAEKHNSEGCPLHAVHRRLDDLHRQWHQAAIEYFDPEAFRVATQAAIQTSRTVTFILKSNKRVIPTFDAWYKKWETAFADDPLMRWMKNARNRIEKQGDLEVHSFVRAEIVASYLNDGPVIEVPAELFDTPQQLVENIPDSALGEHVRKDGIVRIQRRWVENSLPEYELLDAVALAYGRLSEMLDDAHRHMGLSGLQSLDIETGEIFDRETMAGRLPCMIGHSDNRTLNVWLADGRPIEVSTIRRSIDTERAKQDLRKYGISPADVFGDGENAEATLDNLFATATKMFLRDQHHKTIMFLLKGGRPVDMFEIVFSKHGQKYLIMRDIASRVTRKGADGAILVGEAWTARFDRENPYQRAADAPNREEVLMATLVTKQGRPMEWIASIQRDRENVTLSEPTRRDGGLQFLFAPIYEAWGRPIPSDWAEEAAKMADQKNN